MERALALLDPADTAPDTSPGYLDLLGAAGPSPRGISQMLMRSGAVAAVYERWWRPALSRIAKGPFGPGMAGEYRIACDLLQPLDGAVVLDVACGPGNVSRALAKAVGPGGLVLGIDASPAMLARAASGTRDRNVVYVRGDAVDLPFRDAVFDGVCCFAALHLFAEPFRSLDQIARVLAPGGRVAILTSQGAGALRPLARVVGAAAGIRVFGREEIVRALEKRGFEDVERRTAGLVQIVGARNR